ncbi:MAG: hypothetical protein V2I66_04890 [Halieaceae bacterium]|nr:hypothetical protein [Halieaceae bacterium]
MNGKRSLAAAAAALMIAAPAPTLADGSIYGDTRLQAYIGVMELDDQTGELQVDTEGGMAGDPVDIDFANLLYFGVDGETPMNKPNSGFEWGVNAGFSLGWEGGDTEFAGRVNEGGGTVAFRIDNDMLVMEGHIGPYLRTHFGEKVDFYLGAGPAIIYAEVDVDEEDNGEANPNSAITTPNGTIILGDDSDSDVVVGLYARAGLEFDMGGGRSWGLGVKYLGGEMDFNDTVGEFDLEGFSVLLTYSAWY